MGRFLLGIFLEFVLGASFSPSLIPAGFDGIVSHIRYELGR
jgi:hypothetical protein